MTLEMPPRQTAKPSSRTARDVIGSSPKTETRCLSWRMTAGFNPSSRRRESVFATVILSRAECSCHRVAKI